MCNDQGVSFEIIGIGLLFAAGFVGFACGVLLPPLYLFFYSAYKVLTAKCEHCNEPFSWFDDKRVRSEAAKDGPAISVGQITKDANGMTAVWYKYPTQWRYTCNKCSNDIVWKPDFVSVTHVQDEPERAIQCVMCYGAAQACQFCYGMGYHTASKVSKLLNSMKDVETQ